jgi:hypothetical protein
VGQAGSGNRIGDWQDPSLSYLIHGHLEPTAAHGCCGSFNVLAAAESSSADSREVRRTNGSCGHRPNSSCCEGTPGRATGRSFVRRSGSGRGWRATHTGTGMIARIVKPCFGKKTSKPASVAKPGRGKPLSVDASSERLLRTNLEHWPRPWPRLDWLPNCWSGCNCEIGHVLYPMKLRCCTMNGVVLGGSVGGVRAIGAPAAGKIRALPRTRRSYNGTWVIRRGQTRVSEAV